MPAPDSHSATSSTNSGEIRRRSTTQTKRGRPGGRPKSREETPKEGCNIERLLAMLRCTIKLYAADISGDRLSQGPAPPIAGERTPPPDIKRPGAGPGLEDVSSKSVRVRRRGGPAWRSCLLEPG